MVAYKSQKSNIIREEEITCTETMERLLTLILPLLISCFWALPVYTPIAFADELIESNQLVEKAK